METTSNACPACSSPKSKPHAVAGVRVCSCGAHYTTRAIYLGDSYAVVLPRWHSGEERPEDLRYFDLETLGSEGLGRRHGWFHAGTREIVQVG